jgi:hypothetical protein
MYNTVITLHIVAITVTKCNYRDVDHLVFDFINYALTALIGRMEVIWGQKYSFQGVVVTVW